MIRKRPETNTAPKAPMRLILSYFWAGTWTFSACILITIFVLRWWPGDRLIVVRMFNYAMPWFIGALVPIAILAVATNRKSLALTLLTSILYIIFIYLPLLLPKDLSQEYSGLINLKVMSYNVWSHNRDIPGAADLIARVKPDILLMQELSPNQHHKLIDLLVNSYGFKEAGFIYNSKTLLATYSHYPITKAPGKEQDFVQKSVVQANNESIIIYNVHLKRTVLRSSHNWQRFHDRITGLVSNEITEISDPAILGGDFNMTGQTQTYREISRVLKNAHREAGSGFGFTFPSSSRKLKRMITLPPIVRIDHLFFNKHLHSKSFQTLKDSGGSDHLPIVSEFVLLNKP